ncbi:MAG: hypothetical protein DHS20C02_02490 [Micavibrio sp.]|nr:MAG: hypothetical protein DHS20C02_02490 [Micavibrio sp.]
MDFGDKRDQFKQLVEYKLCGISKIFSDSSMLKNNLVESAERLLKTGTPPFSQEAITTACSIPISQYSGDVRSEAFSILTEINQTFEAETTAQPESAPI